MKRESRRPRFSRLLLVLDLCAVLCFTAAYGPWSGFRSWLVTTALNTANHQYLAYVLYDQAAIDAVMAENQTIEPQQATDTSLIDVSSSSTAAPAASSWEQSLLDHEEGQSYKIVALEENGYSGYLTVIYDPASLKLVSSDRSSGATLTEFAADYDAAVAVNAGGSYEFLNHRSGRGDAVVYQPLASLICDGTVVRDSGAMESFIAMDTDGVLILAQTTVQELTADHDISWATVFSPYLIVNGVSSTFTGNGGYGAQPRTAIGQRADGVIIIATIDGRGINGSAGITMAQLADLMARCGCVNAANLDGGGSTELVEGQTIVNHPTTSGRSVSERSLMEALVYG